MKKRRKKGREPIVWYLVGHDNQGDHRLLYALRVWLMNDENLLRETERKIWLSSWAGNNPRSDYHWHVSVCYSEWDRRGKVDQYSIAYNNVARTI